MPKGKCSVPSGILVSKNVEILPRKKQKTGIYIFRKIYKFD